MNLQPPVLRIDTEMATKYGQKVLPRGRIERRVVWNLLAHLDARGFKPVAVHEDEIHATPTPEEVMEWVFNLDEAWVEFTNGHMVFIVLGNDGWDCISDWTYAKGDGDGFNKAMDAFDTEQCI